MKHTYVCICEFYKNVYTILLVASFQLRNTLSMLEEQICIATFD